MSDDQDGYPPLSRALHWLMAAAIVAALASGLYGASLPLSPARIRWVNWHKWIGVTVLGVAVLRLAWRLARPTPSLPIAISLAMPAWQRTARDGVHSALYVCFFATPLAGWVYSSMMGFPVVWLGVLPLPDLVPVDREFAPAMRTVHQVLAYTLFSLIATHIVAVAKHHWLDRDGLMQRMWPIGGGQVVCRCMQRARSAFSRLADR